MEIQTISLALVLLLSLPVVAFYCYFLRKSTNSHLNLLVASDRNLDNQDSLLSAWKRDERFKYGFGAALILLLLVWGAIQLMLGPDGKSTFDMVLSLAFALPMVTAIVAATHFDLADLLNSYGSGQRAELRLSEAYPAS